MSTVYTETPNNIDEFKQFIIEDVNEIKKFFLTKGKIIFYDACSFQRHSKLKDREKQIMELRFGLTTRGNEKTQKEVANILGISQSYISRLEKKIISRLKKEMKKFV